MRRGGSGTKWRRVLAAGLVVMVGLAGCSDDRAVESVRSSDADPEHADPEHADAEHTEQADAKKAKDSKKRAGKQAAAARARTRQFCDASIRLVALDALLEQQPDTAGDAVIRFDYDSLRMELAMTAPRPLEDAAADMTVAVEAWLDGRTPTDAEATQSTRGVEAVEAAC